MKSNKFLYIIIGIVSLAIINLIFFLLIHEYTYSRYVNIAGANLSIIVLWLSGILNTKDESNVFLQYTKYPFVVGYSAITFIISILFILINKNNLNLSIVIQLILLGILIIFICFNKMANNSSIADNTHDKQNFAKIEDMSKSLYLILQEINDSKVYKKVEEAYDAIKNCKVNVKSEPIEIDNKLLHLIEKIQTNIDNNQISLVEENVKEIKSLINKRNNY